MALMRLFLILSFLSSSASAESEKEKIFSLLMNLPKVTTAKIRRGHTETSVDLSKAEAKSQIRDYDVLILDEGVYSTLGNFTAKYVRVRGQGPRKTIISSSAKDSSPILVNSTEFWDLSITDAHFKLSDLNGLWAVNVEFAGSILVTPANPSQSPAFAIRSVFSDLTYSNLPDEDAGLYLDLKEKQSAANLTALEDKYDNTADMNLKKRMALKGLLARALNYLYQKDATKPRQYDQVKFNQLVKNARSSKANGHLYASMLYWAEADRLSGHSRFDEALKEITSMNQIEGGCTIEGQGLATTIKDEIEQNLYTKLPVTALPGNCTIQTLHVIVPPGGNKQQLISAARQKNHVDQAVAYQKSSIFSRSSEDDFLMGAEAPAAAKDYAAVADLEMPGVKKSFTSDIVAGKDNMGQNIIDPIIKTFKEKFAANVKAAAVKIASSDIAVKIDGLITRALYGDEPARQEAYEKYFEVQFGRKISSDGAIGSVFAY